MADYKDVLADLKAKKVAIDRERAKLDAAITAFERLVSGEASGPSTKPASRSGVTSRTFAGLTVHQAVTKYLRATKEPQTSAQIQNALRAGGKRSKSKSFNAIVYKTLSRLSKNDGPYRRERDGRWSLREWPPIVAGSDSSSLLGAATL